MKLLFDQNLSPRLVNRLTDLYPDSQHVSFLGLDHADDLCGFPPKVIWIRRGSCSTNQIEEILRSHYQDIIQFSEDPNLGVLALY